MPDDIDIEITFTLFSTSSLAYKASISRYYTTLQYYTTIPITRVRFGITFLVYHSYVQAVMTRNVGLKKRTYGSVCPNVEDNCINVFLRLAFLYITSDRPFHFRIMTARRI